MLTLLFLSLSLLVVGMAVLTYEVATEATLTITLASLANNAFATSNPIDNSSLKYAYAMIQVKVTAGTSPSATGVINVYLLRSTDGGSTYEDASRSNLLGSFALATTTGTVGIKIFDTSRFGPLGSFWKVAVENRSGVTTNATAGSHKVTYQGVTPTLT